MLEHMIVTLLVKRVFANSVKDFKMRTIMNLRMFLNSVSRFLERRVLRVLHHAEPDTTRSQSRQGKFLIHYPQREYIPANTLAFFYLASKL